MVFLLSGTLFVVSAQHSDGTDLRPNRYTDIASIVAAESKDLEVLNSRVASLDAEVIALTAAVNDRNANRANRVIETLEDPAGFTPRSGPGVTVTLTDAPESVQETAQTSDEAREMVVHQQDIQAVVNAMWRGGAEAITIQGQRLISTTGIKCSGNTVQLQGRPYSPPYVITAVGDQIEIVNNIQSDDYLDIYRDNAADPEIAVGYSVELEDFTTAPAYGSVPNLSYAVPLES